MKSKTIVIFLFVNLLLTATTFAQWVQVGNDINGEYESEGCGSAVSMDSAGNILAIGSSTNALEGYQKGKVRIFYNDNGTWIQMGQTIYGENNEDAFGSSIDLNANGNILAVGAIGSSNNGDNAGQVKLFSYNGSTWEQIGNNIEGNANDSFGYSVSLSSDGNTVAIGASSNSDNGFACGMVKVFQYFDNDWIQVGNNIYGEFSYDQFGTSLCISNDGTKAAVGAPKNDGNGEDAGHVRVFQLIEGDWEQIGNDIEGEAEFDQSGRNVAFDSSGTILAISANHNWGSAEESGHVRVFKLENDQWNQLGNDINGKEEFILAGASVRLSGNGHIVAFGAIGNDNNGPASGATYIYEYNGIDWLQVGSDIYGEAEGDFSGFHIDLSADGNMIAIGAHFNDGNGDSSGHVRVFNNKANNIVCCSSVADISIYPNPTNGQVMINANELKSVEILDIQGRTVNISYSNQLNLNEYNNGIYILNIITTEQIIRKKIIKE